MRLRHRQNKDDILLWLRGQLTVQRCFNPKAIAMLTNKKKHGFYYAVYVWLILFLF